MVTNPTHHRYNKLSHEKNLHKSALRIQIYCDFDKAMTLLNVQIYLKWSMGFSRWEKTESIEFATFHKVVLFKLVSVIHHLKCHSNDDKKTVPRIWPLNHKLFIQLIALIEIHKQKTCPISNNNNNNWT